MGEIKDIFRMSDEDEKVNISVVFIGHVDSGTHTDPVSSIWIIEMK